MKRGIALIGLLLATALSGCSDSRVAAVGTAEAQSSDRPDVSQQIFGHFIPADFDFDEGELQYSLSAMARGNPGEAILSGWLVYDSSPAYPDEGCPDDSGRIDVIRFEWGEVYNDGSLLHGVIDPGQFTCVYANGLTTGEFTGTIDGGKGRFDGASGTWTAKAEAGLGGTTGTVEIYLN